MQALENTDITKLELIQGIVEFEDDGSAQAAEARVAAIEADPASFLDSKKKKERLLATSLKCVATIRKSLREACARRKRLLDCKDDLLKYEHTTTAQLAAALVKMNERVERLTWYVRIHDWKDDKDYASIIGAMERHADDAEVQARGCRALMCLAEGKREDRNDPARDAIAEAGGVAAILGAMGRHEGAAGVQEEACGALSSLAINAANKLAIVEAGGVALVRKAHAMGGSVAERAERAGKALQVLLQRGIESTS